MHKSILVAGVALSLLAGCGSSTETTANQASPEDAALATGPDGPPPQVVDVRGLRLGMSVAQVKAALRASGMPVSDTEDRMFAQREIARTKVYAANRMVPEGRPDLETRSEYEFLSSIVSEGPRGSGRLTAMFTPFRGRERAWGARYQIQYEEATRPSVENTRAALRAKYGAWTHDVGADSPLPRSGSLIWYWNDAGRPGSPDTHAICERGTVAALAQDEDFGFWFPPNLAGTNPARLKTSVDAGCSKVIVARFNWSTDGAVEEMTISALDLRTAYDSGMELAGVLDGRANADANARREAADRNRPTL